MKKILICLTALSFSLSVFAELPQNKSAYLPQGTFKKKKNGQIVQYDKNGKKLGIYSVRSGRYIKIK